MANSNPFIGQVLDSHFVLGDEIGSGAFSLVFEAQDLSTGHRVAIKALHPSRAAELMAVAEFETEGELLAKLVSCRNVISYIGTWTTTIVFTLRGAPVSIPLRFHALELAEGSLEDILPNRDKLSWEQRLDLFRDVVSGTHQMHLQRIIHRDIKCSNACRPPLRMSMATTR